MSKAYISQVKHGKRPPSLKLLDAINEQTKSEKDYLALFMQSRLSMGASPKTIRFYRQRLLHFTARVDYLKAKRQHIEKYLSSIPANCNGLATRHACFRAIKTFYRWLHDEHGLCNPMIGMRAPILGKPIMPGLDKEQIQYLIDKTSYVRDKAIIALLTESGLRLSELTNISPQDINWDIPHEKYWARAEKRLTLHLVSSQRVI
ncbi:tyrosine recombinase XerC [Chloroflexota bacterium]